MSKLNLLVIQDVPPKKKDGWFNTAGLEAYNSSDNQNYGTLDGGPQIKSGPAGNQVTA